MFRWCLTFLTQFPRLSGALFSSVGFLWRKWKQKQIFRGWKAAVPPNIRSLRWHSQAFCGFVNNMNNKACIQRNLESRETILCTYTHSNKHTGTRTHGYTDYAQLNLQKKINKNQTGTWARGIIIIIIDNFCIALFSGVPKLTALYILQHFLSFTNIIQL